MFDQWKFAHFQYFSMHGNFSPERILDTGIESYWPYWPFLININLCDGEHIKTTHTQNYDEYWTFVLDKIWHSEKLADERHEVVLSIHNVDSINLIPNIYFPHLMMTPGKIHFDRRSRNCLNYNSSHCTVNE